MTSRATTRTKCVADVLSLSDSPSLMRLLSLQVEMIVDLVCHLLRQEKYNHERGIVVLCAYLCVQFWSHNFEPAQF